MDDEKVKNALMENDDKFLEAVPDDYEFSDGTRLVHWASMYNNKTVFDRVGRSADAINRIGGALNSTPLYYAIYNSNYRIMKLLLESGADVSYVNKSGLGLLHTCTRFDDVLGIVLLLCYGADIDARDFRGRTLREYGNARRSKHVVRFLDSRVPPRKGVEIGTEVALIGIHGIFLLLGKWYQVGFIALLFSFWRRIVYTRFPMYLNLFYTLYIGYKSFRGSPELVLQILHYIAAMLRLMMSKPRFSPASTYSKSKDLVLKMIEEDRYNISSFCYTCLTPKANGSSHCGICKRCILDFDHHCPCINKCIDRESSKLFRSYLSVALTTTIMILLFGSVPDVSVELVFAIVFVVLVMSTSWGLT